MDGGNIKVYNTLHKIWLIIERRKMHKISMIRHPILNSIVIKLRNIKGDSINVLNQLKCLYERAINNLILKMWQWSCARTVQYKNADVSASDCCVYIRLTPAPNCLPKCVRKLCSIQLHRLFTDKLNKLIFSLCLIKTYVSSDKLDQYSTTSNAQNISSPHSVTHFQRF